MSEVVKVSRLWKFNEHGGWEQVARLRLGGYFARVEDEDGDRSTWQISKDREHVASGEFAEWIKSDSGESVYVADHFELALRAAEDKLRELGLTP